MTPPDLAAADEQTCLAAVATLAAAAPGSSTARDALLTLLRHASTTVRRRTAEALARLSRLDEAIRLAVRDCLSAADPRLRWGAAYALVLAGEDSAALRTALERHLDDEDADVRWATVTLRGRLSGSGDNDGLVHLLRNGTPLQRRMAAYCLRERGVAAPAAAHAVLDALGDGDPAVRLAALAAAVRLISDVARLEPPLERLLADGDARVQRAAAARCREVSDHSDRLVAALRRAACSPDTALRRAAQGSLHCLTRRHTKSGG